MKAITIKQPWASLIVEGIKDIENRTWKTNYRGRVLIHSSADKKFNTSLTEDQFKAIIPLICKGVSIPLDEKEHGIKKQYGWKFSHDYSSIIGSVEIIDCVQNHPSIWAIEGQWHWVLANPIKFEHPTPNIKGKLSFWEFDDKFRLD